MAQLTRFQRYINEVIPLTQSMALRLEDYNGRRLAISAPLEPNHNHQNTAFGGSLYTASVVSAWGLVELVLRDAGLIGNVVVQHGEMEYIEPVNDDFHAVCDLPDDGTMIRFHKSLARYGKARLNLHASIFTGPASLSPTGSALAVFSGRFVVQDARTEVRSLF